MMIDFIRQLNAAKKFSIKKEFEFIEFDDVSSDFLETHETVPDLLEIWAAVKIHFEGDIPESYKVLNLMIGDWVNENIKSLTPVIHKALKEHFKTFYPNSSHEGLTDKEDAEDTAIWTDQLDYMPVMDEKDKFMTIEIELVLETEPESEE